jgi:hypothetical protein
MLEFFGFESVKNAFTDLKLAPQNFMISKFPSLLKALNPKKEILSYFQILVYGRCLFARKALLP